MGAIVVHVCHLCPVRHHLQADLALHFLSWSYLCGLFGALFTLGLYAILWQKILSFMPLNKAFLCKSVTILMVLAVSAFFQRTSYS